MLRLLFRRILPGILFVAVFAAGARAEDPAVTPSTALESYLHNGDLTYGWEVRETVRDGMFDLPGQEGRKSLRVTVPYAKSRLESDKFRQLKAVG